MVDIEKFVRTELRSLRTPIFFPNRFIRGFAYRLLGVSLAFHGNITFRDAIRNFLPSRFKAPETDEKIFSSIRREFDSIIKSKSLHTSTSAMLFGNQIFPAHESSELESWLHTCIMIFQSVVADQYHARRFLKPDSIVIDAGANMGIFSLFSALCAPYGHVYAFEPSPKTYEILLKNTGNNSCISTYNSALGEKEGSGNLILAESSGSNTLSDSGIGQPHAFGEIKVPIRPLMCSSMKRELRALIL